MTTRMVRIAMLACIMVFFGIAAGFAAAEAGAGAPQEPMGSLVVNLSTDDADSADAAIRIATVALSRGHEVTLLMRVRAVSLAVKKNDYPFGKTTIKDELIAFQKAGGKIIMGGSCMQQRGLTPADMIDGVVVGKPDVVMPVIFKENTRILSY